MATKYTTKCRHLKDAFAKLLRDGMPVGKAAKAFKIPRSTAYLWAWELGIGRRSYIRRASANENRCCRTP